jgi:hypothetical protein
MKKLLLLLLIASISLASGGGSIGGGGGGSAVWGSITGTLSSQTDLQSALDAKAPTASPTFTGTVTAPAIQGTTAADLTISARNSATTPTGVTITAGNATAGTGDGGTIAITSGSSVGGADGTIDFSVAGTTAAKFIRGTRLLLPANAAVSPSLAGTVATTTGINLGATIELVAATNPVFQVGILGAHPFAQFVTDISYSNANIFHFGTQQQSGGDYYPTPPKNAYFGTGGLMIGTYTIATAPIVNPLQLLDVRGGAGASYAQFTNTATGATSSDGLLVGIDASGNPAITSNDGIDIAVTGASLRLVTAGKTLSTKEAAGGADCSGGGTLSSGAATVTTSCASSTSRIFVTDTSTGSLAAVGALVVSQKNSGNFHVNSTNVADASTFDWFIVNPN